MSTPAHPDQALREAMSALADGEPVGAVDEALAMWREVPGAREAWSTYHTIGDVMRSQELARHAGGDEAFLAALRTRLAAEPVVLAPGAASGATAGAAPGAAPGQETRRAAAAQDSARRRASWRPPAWLGASAAVAGVAAVAAVVWVVQLQEAEPATPLLAQANAPVAGSSWQARGPIQPAAVQPVAVSRGGAIGASGADGGSGANGASGPTGPTGALAQGGLEDYLRVHLGSPRVPAPVRLEAEGWTLVRVPEGYELQGAVRRLDERAVAAGASGRAAPAEPGQLPQQLQAVYRRGEQRVSVFIDPVAPGQPREPLALRAGATTLLMVPHEQGAFVTVVGEVPLPTLQQFAGALKRHP
ncbi:MAG: MucB/RseB C-terminal domain-containing protein [Rubrivivax sp.]